MTQRRTFATIFRTAAYLLFAGVGMVWADAPTNQLPTPSAFRAGNRVVASSANDRWPAVTPQGGASDLSPEPLRFRPFEGLAAVPELARWSLFGIGLVGLLGYRSRRRLSANPI